ncbi:condensation domain-containing protein, partial [Mesorhizobium mediterraneum]|uniref:condensation domain-containing protein n=1 Tax=Mesorhizobium mediterraneum TaxID=43617 RepID=UPI001FED787F
VLPGYMVPAQLVSIDTMPRTASGKVDRKGLPAPDCVRATPRAFAARPPNPLEEMLCAIWADVLNREGVTSTDNFFELGGHSLNATRVMLRLREALQVEVPLRMLFEHPTVEGLARYVASQTGAVAPAGLPIVTVPRTGCVPVSFAQQRLWFVHEYEAGAATYNCPIVLEISGGLDRAALGRALDEIVGRHEILRTCFPPVDGVPMQVIKPRTALPLVVIDAQDGELALIMAEEFARPFDLKNGPVIRASLIRMSEHRHRLLLAMHHIVWDGWSVGVLCDELVELYAAFSRGRSPKLADLPIQYADFAAWQHSGEQDHARDADLGYWRRLLRGCQTSVRLPFDRARPQQSSHAGASVTARLPEE